MVLARNRSFTEVCALADGHSEIHKWRGSRIKAPITYTGTLALNVPAEDSVQDVAWLQERTSATR